MFFNKIHNKVNKKPPTIPKGLYSGCRWGGYFILAPKIYFRILNKNKDKFIPLKKIVDIERGYTTNANSFFYFSNNDIIKNKINEKYLKPLIKSPRNMLFRKIDETKLEDKVFICHKNIEYLDSTTKKYIKEGEKRGFDKKTSGTENRWYDLGKKTSSLFWQKAHYTKHAVYYSEIPLHFDQSFYGLKTDENTLYIWALLNSSFYAFIKMIHCRRTSGRSVVSAVYELENYPFINPDKIPSEYKKKLVDAILNLNKKKIKPIYDEIHLKERQELDKLIFTLLELNNYEKEELYKNIEIMAKQIFQRDRMR
ncbi:MAG: hypothetical protein ACTSPV_15410 [Candidatus Hodarchaeales archaeon]